VSAVGTQRIIFLGTFGYVNPGKVLVGGNIPANITFTNSAALASASDFEIQVGTAKCTPTLFNNFWVACNLVAPATTGSNAVALVAAGLGFNNVAGGPQTVYSVSHTSTATTVLANSTIAFSSVLQSTPTALLTAADISNVKIGSQTVCTTGGITYNPTTGALSCTTNPTININNFGSLQISADVAGTTFIANNNITALRVTTSITSATTPLAVGASRIFSASVSAQGGTITSAQITSIKVGAQSCTPTFSAGTASCSITISGATGLRGVSIDILGSNFYLATQDIVATPTVTAASAEFAAGAASISFGTSNVLAFGDAAVVVSGDLGGYSNVACTPTALVGSTLTCSLATNLPVAGNSITVVLTAYGVSTSAVKIGTTVNRPVVNAASGREFAVGATSVPISTTGAGTSPRLQLSADGINYVNVTASFASNTFTITNPASTEAFNI
jgi:hypothetical protein